jgi:hypothetical protein
MKCIKYLPSWIVIPIISFIFPLIIILFPSHPFSDPLWEIVPTPNSSAEIMRMSVPHGWVVAYKNLARNIVYIPDEKHEWKIQKKFN